MGGAQIRTQTNSRVEEQIHAEAHVHKAPILVYGQPILTTCKARITPARRLLPEPNRTHDFF